MAWNEPGGSGDNDKDPWGKKRDEQGPPDLEDIIKNLQNKVTGIFGGRGGGGTARPTRGDSGGIIAIVAFLIFGWLVFDSIYVIDQAERGVVMRFGKYVDTMEPGMGFRFPRPIEYVEKVNISEIQRLPLTARLLTKDLNLINISLVVQFKVKDEIQYAFKVRGPSVSLKESTESALREIVGGNTMDDILSESAGREKFVEDTKRQLQITIDKYETGLLVHKVNLEKTQPPEEVQEAFQDAVKADKDDDRYIDEAEAFARDIIPKAEGNAQRQIEEAEAYKQQVISHAQGDASRFLQTLTEYRKAPQITRKRLYLETMEQMLANSSKVMVKVDKGSNVMYLPIDKFMGSSSSGQRTDNRSKPTTEDNNNSLINKIQGSGLSDPRDRSREGRTR